MSEQDLLVCGGKTLAAAITPIGASGIAVVRVVGAEALRIVQQVFKPVGDRLPLALVPGRIFYGRVVDNGQVIDDVVVTVRVLDGGPGPPKGHLADINCHGGVRVVQRILMLLVRQGAGLADPHQIGFHGWPAGSAIEREAWFSLTRASTHRVAMWLSHQQTVLPEILGRCVRHLDSGDESAGEAVKQELSALLERYQPARCLVEGATIVIAGPPNAGKSSLANRLFGQRQSIVSEQPGTTRDWVAEPAAVEGVPIVLTDTAGLRPSDEPIERASIERGLKRVAEADLALLVLDGSEPRTARCEHAISLVRGVRRPARTILVLNKCDLPGRLALPSGDTEGWAGCVETSAALGQGLDRLGHVIVEALGLKGWTEETPAVWTGRQRAGVSAAVAQLPDHCAPAADSLRGVLEI
jgi:tRNA modification GTPase